MFVPRALYAGVSLNFEKNMPIPKDIAQDKIGEPAEGNVLVFVGEFGGAKFFDGKDIPLDGRKYRCDGIAQLRSGEQLRAKFTLIPKKDNVLIFNVICYFDGLWYSNDERALFERLGVEESDATPIEYTSDRMVRDHSGPFLVDNY